MLEADIEACFDSIDHTALMDRVRRRVGDKRVLGLAKAFLKAGILTVDGAELGTLTGTPQGGILTPPTHLAMFTLRVGAGVVAGAFSVWDAVPDGDLFRSDEDVFDEQPQHALPFLHG